jgi:hypothetical protein
MLSCHDKVACFTGKEWCVCHIAWNGEIFLEGIPLDSRLFFKAFNLQRY